MDGKFDFILPDEYLSKNLGVNYSISVKTADEESDDIIV